MRQLNFWEGISHEEVKSLIDVHKHSSPSEPVVNTGLANKIENYYEVIKPELTKREKEVLDVIKLIQPCTMHDVADFMKRPLNTISGRFSGLVTKGSIKIKGKTVDRKSIYEVPAGVTE